MVGVPYAGWPPIIDRHVPQKLAILNAPSGGGDFGHLSGAVVGIVMAGYQGAGPTPGVGDPAIKRNAVGSCEIGGIGHGVGAPVLRPRRPGISKGVSKQKIDPAVTVRKHASQIRPVHIHRTGVVHGRLPGELTNLLDRDDSGHHGSGGNGSPAHRYFLRGAYGRGMLECVCIQRGSEHQDGQHGGETFGHGVSPEK